MKLGLLENGSKNREGIMGIGKQIQGKSKYLVHFLNTEDLLGDTEVKYL